MSISHITARDARRAAMKMASRGYEIVTIIDPQLRKVHKYQCTLREMRDNETTDFTRKHNISKKAQTNKLAYARIPHGIGLETWTPELGAFVDSL